MAKTEPAILNRPLCLRTTRARKRQFYSDYGSCLCTRAFERLVYAFASLLCLCSKLSESVAPNCVADIYVHFKDNSV